MTSTSDTITPPEVPFGHAEPVWVHFEDLDMMGIVHNAKYALLLERALTPYWAERGFSFENGRLTAPDVFHAVVELSISFRAPIRGTGPILVHFWFERFGTTSAEYGFRLLSADGATLHAEGRRAIVRLDPATLRPTPWTEAALAVGQALLRPESASL
ncbi:acyl-CoA thioesterase [Micromonospora sp. NPDC050397]|uniref:acyl-CoA thioesterase n=1 Tax=Micromonospora sp. NPDC050397 TaxID=3364279 RepID=UPI00384ACC3A